MEIFQKTFYLVFHLKVEKLEFMILIFLEKLFNNEF